MEISVRSIFWDNGGFKPSLCFRGRKLAHCIINDENIVRCIDIDVADHDHAPPVPYAGDVYPVSLFRQRIREIAARKGITQKARFLIDRIEIDLETVLPPDDPVQHSPIIPGDTTRSQDPRGVAGVNGPSGRQSPVNPPKTIPVPPKNPKSTAPVFQPATNPHRGTLVHQLATEMKLTPTELRVRLRSVGLHAPYDNLEGMRSALKNYKEPQKCRAKK